MSILVTSYKRNQKGGPQNPPKQERKTKENRPQNAPNKKATKTGTKNSQTGKTNTNQRPSWQDRCVKIGPAESCQRARASLNSKLLGESPPVDSLDIGPHTFKATVGGGKQRKKGTKHPKPRHQTRQTRTKETTQHPPPLCAR